MLYQRYIYKYDVGQIRSPSQCRNRETCFTDLTNIPPFSRFSDRCCHVTTRSPKQHHFGWVQVHHVKEELGTNCHVTLKTYMYLRMPKKHREHTCTYATHTHITYVYLCYTYTYNIYVFMPHIHREQTCTYVIYTLITYMNLCHTYTGNIHELMPHIHR